MFCVTICFQRYILSILWVTNRRENVEFTLLPSVMDFKIAAGFRHLAIL